MEDDPIDPETRYKLFGRFDVGAYGSDLDEFSDYFDENGWPLFGNYNPYTLTHPITGQSWHISPRIPKAGDAADYQNWFSIAITFSEERHLVMSSALKSLGRPTRSPFDVGVYARFESEANKALDGDLLYLRDSLSVDLEPLIAARRASVEMAYLWGEFCSVLSSLPSSVSFRERQAARKNVADKRAKGGSKNNRFAQVKWYLHFRRKCCVEGGMSVREFNSEIQKVIRRISNGGIDPPPGFGRKWFQAVCKQFEDGSYRIGFTAVLEKANEHKKAKSLLGQNPDDEPRIPPTDFSAYPEKR